jgi:endonuclease/exonuclease/phosphatase family metal-dependent hydrolase
VPEQAAALAERPVDVVALQEVRASALAAWREALSAQGYGCVVSSFDDADPGAFQSPLRRLGVLVAARMPLARVGEPELPWTERYLSVRLGESFVVHNLHAPISSKAGQVKVLTLEAVAASLAASDGPAVLLGDFNTPRYESREGEIQSFARTRSGRIRESLGERHDAAELGILTVPGFADAFRARHGYLRRDRSWLYPHGRTGYRLDHILVRGLHVDECEYEHGWRERRLSDHSALWAALSSGG